MVNPGRRARRDDGAVLIIVAVFSLVAVLFLAFVVDIGNQRQNRRQLTTATDSVALAAARDWAADGGRSSFTCADSAFADQLAASNNPVGNPDPSYECQFAPAALRGGVLTVVADEVAEFAFGGVTGVEEGGTNSLSRVRVQTAPGGGLRPIAVCSVNVDLATIPWVESADDPDVLVPPEGYVQPPLVLTNSFAGGPPNLGDEGDLCSTAGNWNQVLFDGANGANAYQDQIIRGAEEDISTGDALDSFTGVGGLRSSDLDQLVNTTFWLPVFETTNGRPGTNLKYYVAGFVEVQLNSYTWIGQSVTFNITPLRYLGEDTTCCLINEFNADYQLCDVGTINGEVSPSADCSLRAIAPPTDEPPDAEPPEDEACAATLEIVGNPPNNYQPAAGRNPDRVNHDLTVSSTVSGDDCGTMSLVLVAPSGATHVFHGSTTSPALSGTVDNEDPIWEQGTHFIEVRSDSTWITRQSLTV